MGFLDRLAALLGDPGAATGFCSAEFPQMWGEFVDNVVDTAYMRQCVASPPPPQQQPRQQQQHAQPPPTHVPAARRVVAIGDLHGDFVKAQRAFRLAGLVDEAGNWAGGDTVAVQVGDILDRGDQELRILYFLERLEGQAAAAGGRLYVLNGNHETMNVGGNFRYATPGATLEMGLWHRWQLLGDKLRAACGCQEVAAEAAAAGASGQLPAGMGPAHAAAAQYNPMRHAYLHPGGPVTRRFFAAHPTVLQVGATLFVHGGVLPQHVDYGLERINAETSDWLAGNTGPAPPRFLRGARAVVWARDYSTQHEGHCNCEQLADVLAAIPGARRMVVGHTIQDTGINAACGGKVLRVDVGLSRGCGDGDVQVLEILGDGAEVRRLREGASAPEPVGLAPGAVVAGEPVGMPATSSAGGVEGLGAGGGGQQREGGGTLQAALWRMLHQRTASASSSGAAAGSAPGSTQPSPS